MLQLCLLLMGAVTIVLVNTNRQSCLTELFDGVSDLVSVDGVVAVSAVLIRTVETKTTVHIQLVVVKAF